jgi:hypothetical protein
MNVNGMVTAVAVGGALTLGASMAAAPAYADTTGTVKARTQRTSAANLNSQTGWWEVGTPPSMLPEISVTGSTPMALSTPYPPSSLTIDSQYI